MEAPDLSTPEALTSEEGLQFASDLVLRYGKLRDLNAPRYDRSLKNFANYIADPDIKDPRDKDKEKWRSFVMNPKAWANTNAMAAVVSDIITSVDPIIQATRRKDHRNEVAAYAENVCRYVLAGNKFRTRVLPVLARNTEIQATQIVKMSYVDRTRIIKYTPSMDELENFWNACIIAQNQTGVEQPDRRTDPTAHDVWCEQMRASGQLIPEYPKAGLIPSNAYIGPWYTLPAQWNLAFDPFVDDLQAQEVIFERIVVPQSYIDKLSRPNDPNAPFDYAAVQKGRQGLRGERFTKWETRYYAMLGLDTGKFPNNETAPYDVLLEAHMPNAPDVKFAVILNDTCIINKDTGSAMPHGDAPYVAINRVRMANSAHGLSPYTPTETLMYEGVALRSSRLDAVQWATNPAWGVSGNGISGVTSLNQMRPGQLYPGIRKEDIHPLTFNIPADAMKEDQKTGMDIDEGWGIDSSVRGQQAQVNRVSLGEYQARRTQATLPLIEVAREIEDALATTIPWIFECFRSLTPEGTLLKIAGGNIAELNKGMLTEALKLDMDFTGATQTRNRSEQAQLALMLVDKFAADLSPQERRGQFKDLWSLNGLPGGDTLLDDAAGKMMQAKFMGIQPGMEAGMLTPEGAPTDPGAASVVPPNPQNPDQGGQGGQGGGPAMPG